MNLWVSYEIFRNEPKTVWRGFQHSLVNLWVSYGRYRPLLIPLKTISAFSGESLGELRIVRFDIKE